MQLQLAVARLQPVPELKVLDAPQPVRSRELLLRSALPRQLPLAETFAGLAKTLQAQPQALPPAVRAAVHQVLQHAARPQQLDAGQVQQQFRSSGLFLEPLLARGETPARDLKLDLLRLLRLLQPAAEQPGLPRSRAEVPPPPAGKEPPARAPAALQQLLRLVEGAVSRLQTQQAASLPADQPGPRQVWQFELPLLPGQQPQAVLVRIERDAAEAADRPEQPPRWTVTLRFDFVSTGRIEARLSLAGEQVSSTFWCERADTDRRLGAGLPHLEDALRAAGLEVGRLASVLGAAPQPLELPRPAAGLLDAHA
jgi:hypothetical protein